MRTGCQKNEQGQDKKGIPRVFHASPFLPQTAEHVNDNKHESADADQFHPGTRVDVERVDPAFFFIPEFQEVSAAEEYSQLTEQQQQNKCVRVEPP